MHEILTAVKDSAAAEGITRVRAVGLVVGRGSGALPDALRFAFEVLASPADAGDRGHETSGDNARDDETGGDNARDDETGGDNARGHDREEETYPRELFRGAVLKIEERPVVARCRQCGLEYGAEVDLGWAMPCPECRARGPELIQGRELCLDYYEGD